MQPHADWALAKRWPAAPLALRKDAIWLTLGLAAFVGVVLLNATGSVVLAIVLVAPCYFGAALALRLALFPRWPGSVTRHEAGRRVERLGRLAESTA